MKSALPEASSDLTRARALSRALSAEPTPPKSAPRAEVPPYTRLSRAAQPTPSQTPMLPPLPQGARWPAIVAWAAGLPGTGAALALDRKGLLVAACGLSDDEATRIGGRLALAFDQMMQFEEVLSLAVEGPQRTVHVTSFGEGEEAVLLAVLASTANTLSTSAVPSDAVPSSSLRRAVLRALG